MPVKVVRKPTSRAIPEHEGDVTGAHDSSLVGAIRGVPVDDSSPSDGDYLRYSLASGTLVPGKADAQDPSHSGDTSGIHGDVEVSGLRGKEVKIDFSLPGPAQDGLPTEGDGLKCLFDGGAFETYWENKAPVLPTETRYIEYDMEFIVDSSLLASGDCWLRPNKASSAAVNQSGIVTGLWENDDETSSADGADSTTIPAYSKSFREGMILHPPLPYRLDHMRLEITSSGGNVFNFAVQIVSSAFSGAGEVVGSPDSRDAVTDVLDETFVGTTPYGDGVFFLPMIYQDEWADAHGRLKVRFVA